MSASNIERIEDRIDKVVAGAVEVSTDIGGILLANMSEVMEFAKMMSVSGIAVGPHLQGKPGTCLAVCVQALEWRMSPFSVASKSYEVNQRLAYESQLIHAVIEARAPLKERLRPVFSGEGDQRKCTISGHIKKEATPLVYESPVLAKCKKKSPLWTEDPDQQLFYYASRAWARRYVPDVLLGIYSVDELEGTERMTEINPAAGDAGLKSRLKGAKQRGFNEDHVVRQIAKSDDKPMNVVVETEPKEPVTIDVHPGEGSSVAPAADPAGGDRKEPEKQPEPAQEEPPKEETPLQRGLRLLVDLMSGDDVNDLRATILEEITGAQAAEWEKAVKGRLKALK